MRIARLYVEEELYGSIAIEGRLPKVITWCHEAFVRHKNTFKYQHASTLAATILLEPDVSRELDPGEVQKVRKSRL